MSRLPAAVQYSGSHGGTGALRQGGLCSADNGTDSKAKGLRNPERQLRLPDSCTLTGGPDNPDIVSRARQTHGSVSSTPMPAESQSRFHPVCAGLREQWM